MRWPPTIGCVSDTRRSFVGEGAHQVRQSGAAKSQNATEPTRYSALGRPHTCTAPRGSRQWHRPGRTSRRAALPQGRPPDGLPRPACSAARAAQMPPSTHACTQRTHPKHTGVAYSSTGLGLLVAARTCRNHLLSTNPELHSKGCCYSFPPPPSQHRPRKPPCARCGASGGCVAK